MVKILLIKPICYGEPLDLQMLWAIVAIVQLTIMHTELNWLWMMRAAD